MRTISLKIFFLIKIGGASEKKIEQALFFPLGLHYLCKHGQFFGYNIGMRVG